MQRCPKCGKDFRGYICSCGYDFTRDYTELWTLNVLTSEDRGNCLSPYELAEKLYRRAAYARALELFEKEAAKGSTDAMCYLGKMYEKGYGCRKNMPRALEWYEKASGAGNSEAERNVKRLQASTAKHEPKPEPKANEKISKPFFKKLTEPETMSARPAVTAPNNAFAAAMRAYREHTDAGYRVAASSFQQAAEAGSINACYYLGQIYEKGLGCEKDRSKALEWYERAADAGNMNAKERRDALKKESEPIQTSPSYSSATVKQTAAKPEYTYKANNYNVNNYSYYSSAYGSATNTSKFGGILHILIGVIGGLSGVFSSIRLIISDISESDAAGLLLALLLTLLIGLPIIMAGIRVGTAKIKWGEGWMEEVKLGWLRVAAFYGAFCVFCLGCGLFDQEMSLLPLSLSLDAMMLYCWMLSSVWFLITRMIIFINAG